MEIKITRTPPSLPLVRGRDYSPPYKEGLGEVKKNI
jgi:hypothetical protein